MRKVVLYVALVSIVGCGGTEDPVFFRPPNLDPAQVREFEREIEASMIFLGTGFEAYIALLPAMADPDLQAALGISFGPDPDPKAPPNSYVFTLPLDFDGDGTPDATVQGNAILSMVIVPVLGLGVTGEAEIGIDFGPLGTFEGELFFEVVSEGTTIWGEGTYMETATGNDVRLRIDSADPVTLDFDPEGGPQDGNLCTADVQGPVEIEIEGPEGFYAAVWEFFFGSSTIQVTSRSWRDPATDPGEPPEALDDSTETLPACDDGRSIADWEGTFILDWSCTPPESGSSQLTFTRNGSNSLEVVDTEVGGGGVPIVFTVTGDPGNPYVVRGFFTETEPGGTYREDVVFTLQPGADVWTQNNVYVYITGPNIGTGGTCGGTGTRQ